MNLKEKLEQLTGRFAPEIRLGALAALVELQKIEQRERHYEETLDRNTSGATCKCNRSGPGRC